MTEADRTKNKLMASIRKTKAAGAGPTAGAADNATPPATPAAPAQPKTTRTRVARTKTAPAKPARQGAAPKPQVKKPSEQPAATAYADPFSSRGLRWPD
jgi:hypothetical protein